MNKQKGFTLIEALVSLSIIAFVIISILNGFSYQQLNTRNSYSKNVAISLAETKIEEFLKFPGSELADGTNTDYIIQENNILKTYDSDPLKNNQYKRTTTISTSGNLKSIAVTVEYGKSQGISIYPFKISLTTQRGG